MAARDGSRVRKEMADLHEPGVRYRGHDPIHIPRGRCPARVASKATLVVFIPRLPRRAVEARPAMVGLVRRPKGPPDSLGESQGTPLRGAIGAVDWLRTKGVAMAKTGRNDLCPCGSGRKFKKCCESKTDAVRRSRILMLVVGVAVVGAVAAGIASFRGGSTSSVRVWDPAHGHYHDASGQAVP